MYDFLVFTLGKRTAQYFELYTRTMNTKINYIQDWLPLVRQANWSVNELANICNVSTRTLERHFVTTLGKTPKMWMCEQRQKYAIELLRNGTSVKETALRLGYRQPTNFTRKYKQHWGCCPKDQAVMVVTVAK